MEQKIRLSGRVAARITRRTGRVIRAKRTPSAWTLMALSLVGCANFAKRPTAYEHCSVERSDGWQLSNGWPANRSALLELESDGKAIWEQLGSPVTRKEVWFSQSTKHMMICRYQDIADACASAATMVEFTRSAETWSAGQVMEKVCWADSKSSR